MKTATLTMTLLAAMVVSAAEIHKAENQDALNLPTSWVGGVVPGPLDTFFWHPLTAADTVAIGGDLSVFGIDFGIYGGANLTVNATEKSLLSIGAGGIEMSNTGKSVTLNPAIRLTADQQWANRAGTFNFNNSAASIDLNGHELTLLGINETKASFTGNGALRIQGSPKFSSGASAPNADVTLINGATFHFNQSASENKTVRAKSVTTDGRHNGMNTVYSQGASRNGYDAVEGALTVAYGLPDVNVAPNSAKSQKLEFGSLVLPDTGAGVRFRGLKLGQVKESELANSGASLIKFVTPPTLVGGIIPGGLATSEAHNTMATSLATYDAEYGVRPLDLETEYDAALKSGETHGNVRLVSADTGTHVVTTLAAGSMTTVNSLMMDTADHTKGQGGIILQGEEGAILKVKSGTIFARQAMADVQVTNSKATPPTVAVDYLVISGLTLDFNGGVARIISRQQKRNNMSQECSIRLDCSITNEGGHGVTYGGEQNNGCITVVGKMVSDYTGPTRVVSGDVWFGKDAVGNGTNDRYWAIPGDLYVYGGNCQNSGHQLKDSADLYVYGGTYKQKGGAWNSGSGAHEVFHDLYQSGGNTQFGNGGTSGGSTDMNDAVITGGTFLSDSAHLMKMEHLILQGGTNTIGRWSSWNGNRARVFVKQGVSIVNTAKGAYAPIRMTAGAWDLKNSQHIPGGDLYLLAGLTFTGNETNDKTAWIESTNRSMGNGTDYDPWPLIRLAEPISFEIGDGAAEVDLAIKPIVADADVNINQAAIMVQGGLVKKGAGTLMLANGGTYTGGTTVEAGRLIVDGALASAVSVASGATFRGGAAEESGALAVTGDVTLASGAKLEAEPGAAMTVTGTLALDGAEVTVKPGVTIESEFLVARATKITGVPTSSLGKFKAKVRNGGTELWIARDNGFVVVVR